MCKISEDSAQDRAIREGDAVAAKIDLAVICEARDRAVAGERPGAAGPDGHDRVVRDHRAPFGVIDDVDRAGEAAAVLERQVQRRDRVDEDIAFQRLRVGGELDLRAVAAGRAPAVRRGIADHAQQIPVGILIFERHARERQDAVRVRDVEQIAVFPRQRAAGHRKFRRADVRVAGHGLVDHDGVDVFRRT